MQTRKLGNSDLEVPVICFGCWAIAGGQWWGEQDERDATDAMRLAVDIGLNFFDTAEGYGGGASEELLGRGLKGIRDDAIIATKASPSHHEPDALKQACEDSLRRLQTDYIDVYQLHWPSRSVPFEDTWAAMEELIEEGKVRVGGVSNWGPQDLDEILQHGHPDVNQVSYSLLFRAIEHEIRPKCVEEKVSILCYSPLMQGMLTGKYDGPDDVPEGRARSRHFSDEREGTRHGEEGAEEETFQAIDRIRDICDDIGEEMTHVAVAWLIAQPGVGSVITGIRNPQQARENAAAADLSLPQDVIDRLDEATRPLEEKLGPNADMWESESRIR
ncbi:MAG: aldo/keto reductase [Armatimonadota bacterium]|nr:aldo/keto reductase [Armatimonadota bacterium]